MQQLRSLLHCWPCKSQAKATARWIFLRRVLPGRNPRRNGVSRRSFWASLPIENLASHLSVLQKTTGEALSVFGGVVSSTHARFFGRTVVVRERAEGESVRSNPRGSPRRRRRQAYGTSRPARTVSNTHHRCAHGEHAQRLPQPATKLFCPFSSNCVGPTLELIYSTIALEGHFRRDLVALRANQ